MCISLHFEETKCDLRLVSWQVFLIVDFLSFLPLIISPPYPIRHRFCHLCSGENVQCPAMTLHCAEQQMNLHIVFLWECDRRPFVIRFLSFSPVPPFPFLRAMHSGNCHVVTSFKRLFFFPFLFLLLAISLTCNEDRRMRKWGGLVVFSMSYTWGQVSCIVFERVGGKGDAWCPSQSLKALHFGSQSPGRRIWISK